MAQGGEVNFCASDRAHESGCEYFAEGGDTIPEGYALEGDTPEAEPEEIPEGFQLEEERPALPEGSELEEDKYSSPIQQVLTSVEGGVTGLLGGLAPTLMANNPFILIPEGEKMASLEEQKGRRETNPGLFHTAEAATVIGGMLTGTGQSGAITKASEALVGSKVLQGCIQSGFLQANDEAAKWALGMGNPEDAAGSVMAVGAACVFGGLMGKGGDVAAKGSAKALRALSEEKLGARAMGFLHGIASAAKSQEGAERQIAQEVASKTFGVSLKDFKAGVLFFDNIIPSSTGAIGAVHGWQEDGVAGAIEGLFKGFAAGLVGSKAKNMISPIVAPAMMKILSSGGVVGAAEALDHAASSAFGSKLVNSSIEGLFKADTAMIQQSLNAYGDGLTKDLDNFIGNGGITQNLQQEIYDQNGAGDEQGFAEGGKVEKPKKTKGDAKRLLRPDDGVAIHYPEQNILLSTARGRISTYLNGLRPQPNQPKLPFDSEPDNKQQKKGYERALSIAVSPLSIMKEIQKGTIEPDHIKHLNAMYPELTSLMQKRITQQIVKAQLSGKKPPYKIRQGLSMFMGAALSGEMTPTSIQAAQSVFAKGAPQQPTTQQVPKKSSSTNTLSKVDQSFLTKSQGREQRAQRD